MPFVKIEYGIVRSKDKIERIKLFRRSVNFGLKEAMDVINEIDRDGFLHGVLIDEMYIDTLIENGFVVDGRSNPVDEVKIPYFSNGEYLITLPLDWSLKIQSIKALRAVSGFGLREAKDFVDSILPYNQGIANTVKLTLDRHLTEKDIEFLHREGGFIVSGGIRNHFTDVEDLFTL